MFTKHTSDQGRRQTEEEDNHQSILSLRQPALSQSVSQSVYLTGSDCKYLSGFEWEVIGDSGLLCPPPLQPC